MAERKNLIRLAIATALGAAIIKRRTFDKIGPHIRDSILQQVAVKMNYHGLEGSNAVDSFCYPIPGGGGDLALKTSELIAEPGTKWEEIYRYQRSLDDHGYVTYMEIRPASQKWLPRWFLLREHIEAQRLSSSYEHLDGETKETTRTYLIGRRHLPTII